MTARAPGAVLVLGAAALAALLGGILALLAAKAGPLALVLPGLLMASIALAFVPKATATIAVTLPIRNDTSISWTGSALIGLSAGKMNSVTSVSSPIVGGSERSRSLAAATRPSIVSNSPHTSSCGSSAMPASVSAALKAFTWAL